MVREQDTHGSGLQCRQRRLSLVGDNAVDGHETFLTRRRRVIQQAFQRLGITLGAASTSSSH